MKRWIVNILCGLSALLFVVTVGMWVRSYWVSDNLNRIVWVTAYQAVDSGQFVCSLQGHIILVWEKRQFRIPPPEDGRETEVHSPSVTVVSLSPLHF